MALFDSGWNEDNWREEIMKKSRNYFDIDVSEETVELIRNKVEQMMLNSLRPKMNWVQKSTSYTPTARFYCSNCGNDEMYKTPFCPICGAMEVKE